MKYPEYVINPNVLLRSFTVDGEVLRPRICFPPLPYPTSRNTTIPMAFRPFSRIDRSQLLLHEMESSRGLRSGLRQLDVVLLALDAIDCFVCLTACHWHRASHPCFSASHNTRCHWRDLRADHVTGSSSTVARATSRPVPISAWTRLSRFTGSSTLTKRSARQRSWRRPTRQVSCSNCILPLLIYKLDVRLLLLPILLRQEPSVRSNIRKLPSSYVYLEYRPTKPTNVNCRNHHGFVTFPPFRTLLFSRNTRPAIYLRLQLFESLRSD